MSRVLTACAALLLALLPLTPAPAQSRGVMPQLELEVQGLTGTLRPNETFTLQLRVRNAGRVSADRVRLVGTLHRRVTSRFEYQQALDGERLGRVFDAFSEDVDALPARGARSLTVSSSAADLGFSRPENKYGVYPLRLQLEADGEVVDEVRTSVVLVPDQIEQPVHLGLLWPLASPDAAPGYGTPEAPVDATRLAAALAEHGPHRLHELATALTATPGVPVTLASSGLLLTQLAELALAPPSPAANARPHPRAVRAAQQILQAAQAAVSHPDTETTSLTYGPGDLVALVRAGLDQEAARHVSVGRAAVEAVLGTRTQEQMLWPPDGLNEATLTEVLGAGVDTLILSEHYLEVDPDRDLRFSPGPVHRLRTPAGVPATVLVPDPWLEEALAAPARDGPVVASQRIVGETATVYFERPNASAPRGLLLAPPQLWAPGSGLPSALLDALASAPWLRLEPVSRLVQTVPAGTEPLGLSYPRSARIRELPASYLRALAQARRAMGSLTGVLTGEQQLAERFDRALLAAGSTHYRSRQLRPAGRALLSSVAEQVAALFAAVHVVEAVPVTLTSAQGQVPVTIRSTAPVPLDVRVRVRSSRYRFPAGTTERVRLQPGEPVTIAFAVEALTAGGTYPVHVVVEDALGAVHLAEGRVVVRSTAYSVTAVVVTIGAALFLVVWWLRDSRQRRRAVGTSTERAERKPAKV